jgi:transcriptional regulator PpsR
VIRFHSPQTSIGNLTGHAAAELIAAAADMAVVIDSKGLVQDIAFSSALEIADAGVRANGHAGWIGRRFLDTLTLESRPKVEELLSEVRSGKAVRPREVNHAMREGGDLPIRYNAVPMPGSSAVILLGQDLRALSRMQQRLVEAQRTLERDYAKLKQAETRYRLLFHVTSEPVAIVDGQTRRVIDANPALVELSGSTAGDIVARPLMELVDVASTEALDGFVASALALGKADPIQIGLRAAEVECVVRCAVFRQDGGTHLLLRFEPVKVAGRAAARVASGSGASTAVLMALPDGFVLTDLDRRIIDANAAFLDMVQLTTPELARGGLLETWLGRPGVDVGVLMSNLREHGVVRDFGTVLNGTYGVREEVEVTAVMASDTEPATIGFIIRRARSGMVMPAEIESERARSPGELANLVGRVPLKDLVRESADVIEKLAIEAALKITRDNRAAAAQMLGLSRQSLYAKLRRYGIGSPDDGELDDEA